MNILYLITGIVLLAYLILVWILGGVFHLKGADVWVFRIGLALIGIGAALGFVWWRRRSVPGGAGSAPESSDNSNEVDVLIRDAEARLAAARISTGSRIANFPLVFVMGEAGAAKTSVIVHSGLEPELLAGQVYQDTNIIPTGSANFWYAQNSVFAEAGGKLAANPALWTRLIRRCRAGKLTSVVGKSDQAPRAAIVCFDAENFTKSGAGEAAAAARSLHTRLSEISAVLGINFPVYVLFTRMDRLPFFREYVRNLSNDEATQVVGATLPLSLTGSGGVYGQQQGERVGFAFDNLFRSLCDARPELLARESDPATQPATYEFPREFRKIRSLILQFLVDLCRPSQITTAAFLRGFYFSGVRPVVVNETAPVSAAAVQKEYDPASGATGVFRVGQTSHAPVEARVTGSKRIPQWLFLSHLLNDVVLQDKAAMGASASSTKTSSVRRLLLGCAAALCLILIVGFTVSWIRNSGLESRATEAARGISSAESTGQNLPSADALKRLESLRQVVAELGTYERDGAPWSMRWGLYTGSNLYPEARRAYFSRFRQLLFGQTQGSLLAELRRLPGTPGPNDEYGSAYDALKGYLITTSHHDRSTTAFLTPLLMKHWMAGRTVDSQRAQLAQAQFDFYGEELKAANPFASENDALTIERGRRYLSQFAGIERVYRNMLADVSKSNPPIQFNKKFPGSAEVLVDSYEVSGAFTKGGWDLMKDAIRHADRYFSGEQWVLGDVATASLDRSKLETELRDRYTADFIAQWRAQLKAAAVVRYASIPDAARKLNLLAGNQSPLLALFWLASQNTAVDEPKISIAFQPVQAVVPPSSVDRYIAAPNQPYMSGLASLQAALDQIAAQPGQVNDGAANQVLGSAGAAKSASRQVAQAFRPDPEGRIDSTVQKLMEDPITYVEGLLRTLGPAELNAKGRALCAQLRPVLSKYPFNPTASVQATLAEVNSMLRKPDGTIWVFYDANLQRLLPRQGTQYVAVPSGGMTLSPAFVGYFNRAASLSDAFYSGGSQDPRLTYTLKPVSSEGIQDLTLRIDGHVLTASRGNGAAEQFVWPGTTVREAKASVKFGGTDLGWSNNEGLWAVFQFFEEAERWQPTGASYQLEWIVRAGKNAMTLPSGKPLTVRFDLNMGGSPPVFEKNFLSKLGCVADVAR